jgi:iron complex transport system permease protein
MRALHERATRDTGAPVMAASHTLAQRDQAHVTGGPAWRPRAPVALGITTLLVLGALLAGTAIGAVPIDPRHAALILLRQAGLYSGPAVWTPAEETILLTIRLPRVVAGALAGAALATTGALYQGMLRNPLADPYVIGSSAGAALGATIALLLGGTLSLLGFGLVPLLAALGALASVLLVYNVARVGGRVPVVSLLLAGFVAGSSMTGIMSLLIVVNDRLQLRIRQLFLWLMGGISVSGWQQLQVVAPATLVVLAASFGIARTLNAFALGEDVAASLGISVELAKLQTVLAGAALTGLAVSISGLIGFVGLVVPHAVRLVLGPDHRLLLPATALVGAAFLVLADTLARTVAAPSELPVGVLTALTGAPFFLLLLRQKKREYAL